MENIKRAIVNRADTSKITTMKTLPSMPIDIFVTISTNVANEYKINSNKLQYEIILINLTLSALINLSSSYDLNMLQAIESVEK